MVTQNEHIGNCIHCNVSAFWNEEEQKVIWQNSIDTGGCMHELPLPEKTPLFELQAKIDVEIIWKEEPADKLDEISRKKFETDVQVFANAMTTGLPDALMEGLNEVHRLKREKEKESAN